MGWGVVASFAREWKEGKGEKQVPRFARNGRKKDGEWKREGRGMEERRVGNGRKRGGGWAGEGGPVKRLLRN